MVDVRQLGEWEAGHIDGAHHAPLNAIAEWKDDLPRDRRLAVICKSGYRSCAATSILAAAGYEDIVDVRGGMDAWDGVEAETTPSCS